MVCSGFSILCKEKTIVIVDSYSEYVLNPKQSNVVSTLPNGQSREEFIVKLDVLIGETFPEMTPYSEEEYRKGKVILLLVKKYCLSNKAFGNAPQAPDFSEYLNVTKKILDDELNRMVPAEDGTIPAVDFDKAFTVVSNAMQLLTSAIDYWEKRVESDKNNNQPAGLKIKLPFGGNNPAPQLDFARESTELADVTPYLDNVWQITKHYTKAKALLKFQSEAFIEWNEFKYLKMILQITKMRLDEIGVF